MARVNIDQKAFSDPRFTVLAKLLNLADADHALGKMARVWNECQERGTYVLDRVTIDAIFGIDGASKSVVTATLAEYRSNRVVRIKGTEGRIEWLQKRREDGKRGGRPSKTLGLTLGIDGKQRTDNPPAPAPAPALIPDSVDPPQAPPVGGVAPTPLKRGAARARPTKPTPAWETAAKDHAFEAFRAVHGAEPSWTAREFKALYAAIRRCHDLAEFTAAWGRFLAETHETLVHHDPRTFEARLDRWRGKRIAPARTSARPSLAERNRLALAGWGEDPQ